MKRQVRMTLHRLSWKRAGRTPALQPEWHGRFGRFGGSELVPAIRLRSK